MNTGISVTWKGPGANDNRSIELSTDDLHQWSSNFITSAILENPKLYKYHQIILNRPCYTVKGLMLCCRDNQGESDDQFILSMFSSSKMKSS